MAVTVELQTKKTPSEAQNFMNEQRSLNDDSKVTLIRGYHEVDW